MKEVEVLIGILLIVTGAMIFETDHGVFGAMFGLMLLGAGAFLYLFAVDTLDESKNKGGRKKKQDDLLDYL
jgi:multisubunit Na+/H+ antiporter MnhC subunit